MVENLENGGDVFVNHCRSHRRILTNLINKNQQKQISSDLLNFINEINLIKCREDNNADKRGMISGFWNLNGCQPWARGGRWGCRWWRASGSTGLGRCRLRSEKMKHWITTSSMGTTLIEVWFAPCNRGRGTSRRCRGQPRSQELTARNQACLTTWPW